MIVKLCESFDLLFPVFFSQLKNHFDKSKNRRHETLFCFLTFIYFSTKSMWLSYEVIYIFYLHSSWLG